MTAEKFSEINSAEKSDEQFQLAESIDKDQRFVVIKEAHIAEWEKLHGSRYGENGVFTREFKDFVSGTGEEGAPLNKTVYEEFAKKYLDAAQVYMEKEKLKVAEDRKREDAIREKIKSDKQKETEQQERATIKRELQAVESDFLQLSGVFQKREVSGFEPLLCKEDYSRISSGARSLAEGFTAGGRANYENIARAFRSIQGGFEKYGTYAARGPIREDTNSLGSVTSFLGQSMEGLRRLRSAINRSEQEDTEEVVAAIVSLDKRLESLYHFTAKKRSMLAHRY